MTQRYKMSAAYVAPLACLTLFATGCHQRTQVAYQPPPPAIGARPSSARSSAHANPSMQAEAQPQGKNFHGKPVFTEEGTASWYGVNYNHRNAADGSIYDENGMTAAHRTLPMGSIVRVTNLATGKQVMVRITDRGPFAPNRVIDLSKGAAQAIDLYRAGVAKVRIEAVSLPSSDPAGHWCVQTGALKSEAAAIDLKAALKNRYQGAKVIEFHGPTGYWVRIDPALRDRKTADQITTWIGKPNDQAQAYLVRTD
jgi:rare lipoprotein A